MLRPHEEEIKVLKLLTKIKINNVQIYKYWKFKNIYIYSCLEYSLGLIIRKKVLKKLKLKNEFVNINFLYERKDRKIKKIKDYFSKITNIKNKNNFLIHDDFEFRLNELKKCLTSDYDTLYFSNTRLKKNKLFVPSINRISPKTNKFRISCIDKKIYKYLNKNEVRSIIYFIDNYYLQVKDQYEFCLNNLKSKNYKIFFTWDHYENIIGLIQYLKEKNTKIFSIQHKIITDYSAGFLNIGIPDKYKNKFVDHYYVWNQYSKNKLIEYNYNYKNCNFPKITSNLINYKKSYNKKLNILYFTDLIMDYKRINSVLRKLIKLDCSIHIKDRLKQNLLKKIDPIIQKKSIIKTDISNEFVKKMDLIIVSRSSSFLKYTNYKLIFLNVKNKFNIMDDFLKKGLIREINLNNLNNMELKKKIKNLMLFKRKKIFLRNLFKPFYLSVIKKER